MRSCRLRTLALFALGIFFLNRLPAEVTLPAVISSNMVLQQKATPALWGTAGEGKTVTVQTSWNKRTYHVKADASGNWKIHVVTPSFGGPYTIRIAEENTITLEQVLIGDVWLCSGQSNMEMPLAGWGKILNYEQEIANANYPNIRLLQAIHVTSNQPVNDLEVRNSGWDICTPKTVADFSAVAYAFAREIYEKTKIPIGLIHSSWGGTIAEAWTSYETLQRLPDFAAAAQKIKETPGVDRKAFEQLISEWNQKRQAADKGIVNGKAIWAAADLNTADWKTMPVPGHIEDNGLPGFDGAVWFKRSLSIPEHWKEGDLTLSLGPIDDEDITWFNGEQIGATSGWDQERVYTIPARLIKKGNNDLTVRVTDNSGSGGIYGTPAQLFIRNREGQKIELRGNWLYKVPYALKDLPPVPVNPSNPNRPTVLYNAMINPLISYTIKGAIWYQGESNAGRAYQYRELFPAMIRDWRSKFSSGNFPFYFVQLANFMKRADQPGPSAWAELREAQLMTTQLSNTGMATIIDIGDAGDIHPKNKQEVGRRLALIALNKDYKKKNEYSGPRYRTQKINGDRIILGFDHAEGMKALEGKLTGFAIAGADQRFYWADAEISGSTITVKAPEVKQPVAVRYGWADNPEVNLVNGAGLPASPFRTDQWDGVTKAAK
ncbi:sialate O-acetylesterase [Niabella drilacis]|uniref:Sialate O-acetylesterase n=1 Tax=Niabella drilacis (strain DSM 25811 / CCM 8410 / CCUG 62505 / LMG 26954 / E90) TaxID=1285928 RepID=A0A1G6M6J7_NIADE|nr:sialate O-acetylesterase [Niabella drilacis]SDC50596.1 sialate O-acetylesterase [Niabella drilacis]